MADETAVAVAEPTIETRQQVIAKAIAVADKEQQVEDKPVVEDKKPAEEPAKAEEKKEETPDPEVLLAQQGKDLMKALQDPVKGRAVAQYLMDAYGLGGKPPETKAEVKEIRNDILEDLKEGLGEEFSVIADRLAPAIEKILAKKLEENTKDIRASIQAQEQEKLEVQSASALTKYSQDFFGADEPPADVAKEMNAFMNKFEPTPDMSVKEYLKDAFDYATGKLGLTKMSKSERETAERKQTRTNTNSQDAASRLASERVPSPDNLRKDSKPMSRVDAIRAAIEQADKG